MFAAISAIEYHLPETKVTNQQLEAAYPDWSAEKIFSKTGIDVRCHAAANECASDLALAAAQKLFASGSISPAEIDFLLLCTQAPDYIMPASACLLQERLALPTRVGALDFSLGCSGFVYGLGLAKGLIESQQAKNILLLTTDTMSKVLHPDDPGCRSILGDGAAATLVQARHARPPLRPRWIGPFVYGTDGTGRDSLIVRGGGMRERAGGDGIDDGADGQLYMDGPEVLIFSLRVVPQAVNELLRRTEICMEDVDLFVFHQANAYMLEQLRIKMNIPEEKFVLAMRHCGNTTSSSIPIALKEAQARGQLRPGMCVMLLSFGIGFSWGATLIQWQ